MSRYGTGLALVVTITYYTFMANLQVIAICFYQGYTHAVKDPAMTYRVETMPGLGW